MSDKDIEEYHNIGRKIKFTDKYNYIQGRQSMNMDHGPMI